jgi:hypothetical protein
MLKYSQAIWSSGILSLRCTKYISLNFPIQLGVEWYDFCVTEFTV